MPLVVKDRVKETTTTTGTGTLTLAGASPGFQAFSAIGNANTTYYTITDNTNWETGVGTYTLSGTTLSRDTILASSNSGNAVNWGAGSKTVFCGYPAERAVDTVLIQTLTNKTLTNPTVTNYVETQNTANTGASITINLADGTVENLTLTANTTITMPTAVAGKSFIIYLKTGTGGFSVTWSTVKWPSGIAPAVTTTASRMDIYSFFSDGTNWYGTTVGQNYTP